MADLHEVVFQWPHTEPTTVILTGTFDDWSEVIHLTKGPTGFQGSVRVPWNEKIAYKFIVDGEWKVHEDQPKEADHDGNINNIYIAPTKPSPSTLSTVPAAEHTQKTSELASSNDTVGGSVGVAALDTDIKMHGQPHSVFTASRVGPSTINLESVEGYVAETSEPVGTPIILPISESATEIAEVSSVVGGAHNRAVELDSQPDVGEPRPEVLPGSIFPQMVSDFADTIVAREGTSSALGYVASGLGAAIHNVVGVDPINADKLAIPTPKLDVQFLASDGNLSTPVLEHDPPSIAPDILASIVPVNTPDNNTNVVRPTYSISRSSLEEANLGLDTTPITGMENEIQILVAPIPKEPSTHSVVVSSVSESTTPAVGEISITPLDNSSSASVIEVAPEPTVSVVGLTTEVNGAEIVASIPAPTLASEPVTAAETPEEARSEPATTPLEPVVPPIPIAELDAVSDAAEQMPRHVEPISTAENETILPIAVRFDGTPAEPISASVLPTVPSAVISTAESGSVPVSEASSVGTWNTKSEGPAPIVVRFARVPEPTRPVDVKPEQRGVMSEFLTSSTAADGSVPTVEEEKADTNGDIIATPVPPLMEEKAEALSAPSTSAKVPQHSFPSSGSPPKAVSNSPSSSKVGTTTSRKKRTSLFGKLKHVFSHDKDKDKEEK